MKDAIELGEAMLSPFHTERAAGSIGLMFDSTQALFEAKAGEGVQQRMASAFDENRHFTGNKKPTSNRSVFSISKTYARFGSVNG